MLAEIKTHKIAEKLLCTAKNGEVSRKTSQVGRKSAAAKQKQKSQQKFPAATKCQASRKVAAAKVKHVSRNAAAAKRPSRTIMQI